METFFTCVLLLAAGYMFMDIVIRLLRGPYRCSCGYETYNADDALRHQGHAKHTME